VGSTASQCELLFCDSPGDSTIPDFQLTHDTSHAVHTFPQHIINMKPARLVPPYAIGAWLGCDFPFALLQDFFHEILGSPGDVSYRFWSFPFNGGLH
jgi:hypothetical protein